MDRLSGDREIDQRFGAWAWSVRKPKCWRCRNLHCAGEEESLFAFCFSAKFFSSLPCLCFASDLLLHRFTASLLTLEFFGSSAGSKR